MYKEVNCVICGKRFMQYTRRDICCSDECRRERMKQRLRKRYWKSEPPDIKSEAVCPVCGVTFKPRRTNSVYCSYACRAKAKAHGSRREKPKKRTCLICGKTFYSVRPKWVCSEECRKERDRIARKKRKNEKPAVTKTEDFEVFTCVICGTCFFDVQTSTRKTCCHKCSEEYSRMTSKKHRDKRLNEETIVDNNISLRLLFMRDNGMCWLCGEKCKWPDKKTRHKKMTPGPSYPTIDHVIPLARGGLHAWDNVRLAHWKCNIKKSDAIVEEDEALPPKLIILPSVRKKRTAQLSRDGELIREYESTQEAADWTGFKAKQIQNCARGEAKTYRGFKWVYLDDAQQS